MLLPLNRKRYNSLGFVEALIALVVSGVVAIVLMSISTSAIRELRKLDMQDAMAQQAVSASVLIQKQAIEQAKTNAEGNLFYSLKPNHCYTFSTDGELEINPYGSGGFAIGLINDRNKYDDSVIPSSDYYDDIFAFACTTEDYKVVGPTSPKPTQVIFMIVTGSLKVAGRVTNESDVKDYEYFAVINL